MSEPSELPEDQRRDDPGVEAGPPERPQAAVAESTGDPQVDAVVDSLSGLDEAPVADHVAVFEQAHADLRARLAGGGE